MTALLIFAIALLVAVLLSKLADRSVLSMAVLFLAAGFLCGPGMLEFIALQPQDPVVQRLAELALFSILFTDGMRLNLRELTSNWRLPGRALLVGLPLTLLGTAVLAHYVAGLSWLEALLVGAILSPTDPVFAAAIIGRSDIPPRLRHLLHVESGLNDGLALPIVLALMAFVSHAALHAAELAGELALGIALGAAVPWAGCRLEQSRFFAVGKRYEPLFAFSLGLLVLALALLTHATLYLAAFAAGITVATVRSDLRDEFHQFGEIVAELLKLAALLVFGVLMSPNFLAEVPLSGYLFAALALLVVRPIAIALSLVRSRLGWRERITAGWFGPKGFASVIYGLLIVQAAVPGADRMFHLVGVVVAGSMVAHSSTDVLFARWFRRTEGDLKLQQ
ncbi:MAG: cation:proton antiporter [Gemmatimonadales bacterium]|nr:cation:proton antiporter [Gemmatimonadales bacterium]